MAIILVTGAAGFIGMAVASQLLSRGDMVIGVDNLNDYYSPVLKQDRIRHLAEIGKENFEFRELDIANFTAMEALAKAFRFDSIIHLGAQAGVRYSIDNPHAYVQSNLVGHLNMLEIARYCRIRHMVYASSSSVYGANKAQPFRVTDRVDHPVSLYAATKKADELMSESYAHLYRIPLTGLRFFTVYGPWGRPDMAAWNFTKNILSGAPIDIFNNGEMKRDFTFIDDIVAGVIACLDSPSPDDGEEKPGGSVAPHRVYNIGNNRSEKLMRLVELLEDACERKAQCRFLPMQPGDVHETYADIDAIQRDVGYVPMTSIDVGIPRFVSWFKEYHGLA